MVIGSCLTTIVHNKISSEYHKKEKDIEEKISKSVENDEDFINMVMLILFTNTLDGTAINVSLLREFLTRCIKLSPKIKEKMVDIIIGGVSKEKEVDK